MQPGQYVVLVGIPPKGVFFFAAPEAGAIGGVGGAELEVDGLGGGLTEQGGDVLPALDGFAVIAAGCAALSFCDQ